MIFKTFPHWKEYNNYVFEDLNIIMKAKDKVIVAKIS